MNPWNSSLKEGIALLSDLLTTGLPAKEAEQVEILLGLCHLLRFRLRTGCDLPLIGIVGSANSGKSTLFNSLTDSDISKVTPIPHQTTGPIVAARPEFEAAAGDDSFLRPVVDEVTWASAGTAGLSGLPARSTVVPVPPGGASKPFLLVDLPDLGTVDSQEEHQVAQRLLPWLDRAILLVNEESFAQADHEEIERALRMLHPPEARAELHVVLNRRHGATQDAEFESRLETVRSLWSGAAIASLLHLNEGDRFPAEETGPLVAESRTRPEGLLREALRTLAADVATQVKSLSAERIRGWYQLKRDVDRDVQRACRFRKAFFSDDFSKRLDAFSPWRTSMKRLRTTLGKEAPPAPPTPDLFSEAVVERHVLKTAREIRDRAVRYFDSIVGWTDDSPATVPEVDEEAICKEVAGFVARINDETRKHVKSILESFKDDTRLKDPLWNVMAAVASTAFLVDLFIPMIGSLGTLTVSGILSALGLSGSLTSELVRKLRTGRLREAFEDGLREILQRSASEIFASKPLLRLDLSALSRRHALWTRDLPVE